MCVMHGHAFWAWDCTAVLLSEHMAAKWHFPQPWACNAPSLYNIFTQCLSVSGQAAVHRSSAFSCLEALWLCEQVQRNAGLLRPSHVCQTALCVKYTDMSRRLSKPEYPAALLIES